MDFIEKHMEKFGVEPVIIGLRWQEPDLIESMVHQAIDNGKPYNEEKELSTDELELFKKGELFF